MIIFFMHQQSPLYSKCRTKKSFHWGQRITHWSWSGTYRNARKHSKSFGFAQTRTDGVLLLTTCRANHVIY